MKVRLLLTEKQELIVKNWFDTGNYVYNRTVEEIEVRKHSINFQSLRDKLVTYETRKNNQEYSLLSEKIKEIDVLIKDNNNESEIHLLQIARMDLKKQQNSLERSINPNIKLWELETPKEIRANVVNDVVKAYKTAFTNLKRGNIKYFKMKYRKKQDAPKSFMLQPNQITLVPEQGYLKLMPSSLGKDDCMFKIGERDSQNLSNIKIENSCRLVKEYNRYFIYIPIAIDILVKSENMRYCGVDAGLTDFMSIFSNEKTCKHTANMVLLKKLTAKIFVLKSKRLRKGKRRRKKAFAKREQKKSNIVDEIHWKSINYLIENYDIIFYGDIKSHDIVKKGKFKFINLSFNTLKFYKYKCRLLYKAHTNGKTIVLVNESYTTKCCSSCGSLSTPRDSKIYVCSNTNCGKKFERDDNSGKDMIIKGLLHLLSL